MAPMADDLQPGTDDGAPPYGELTNWDRRVVRAMNSADFAFTVATVLRVAAAGVVVTGMIAMFVVTRPDLGDDGWGGEITFGLFLAGTSAAVFGGAVLLGASLLVQLYGARLDLAIVATNDDELGDDTA